MLLVTLVAGAPAIAQDTASGTPASVSPHLTSREAFDAILARMSDDQVNALMQEQLTSINDPDAGIDASATASTPGIERLWSAFTAPIRNAVHMLPVLPERQGAAIAIFVERQGGAGKVGVLLVKIFAILATAFAAERLFRYFVFERSRAALSQHSRASLFESLRFLSLRLAHELAGLFVFFIVTRMLGHMLLASEHLEFASPVVLHLIWYPRLAAALSRFVLAPKQPDLRLVALSDRWAVLLHWNLIGIVLLASATVFIENFNASTEVGMTGIGFWLESALYAYVIIVAWTARDALRGMVSGADPQLSRVEGTVAHAYPAYVIVVAALTWVLVLVLGGLGQLQQILEGAHHVTLFWLVAAPIFDTAIRSLVRHLMPPMSGENDVAMEAREAARRSYVQIGRVFTAGVILILLTGAWDVPLLAMIEDKPGISDNVFAFLLTIVVGYLGYQGVSIWASRLLTKEDAANAAEEPGDHSEIGGVGKSRLSTVLPLVRVAAIAFVVAIFGLLAIHNLGVEIAPLLAGAGVVGLAIGFGAQKLVADIVSGLFFLIDDAFRIGEYIDCGGIMGTVEKISIRSMRLRHHRGAVHTIPYGEIRTLTNYSRDWAIMKLKFTVPFDTDPNQIKKIFKQIGQEMMENPEFADDFIEPFKSQGVFEFDDVEIVVRGKFMAKPGKQFTLRKEIFNKVREAFDANGISFARREVRVALAKADRGHELTDEDLSAIGAAASDGMITEKT